MTITKLGEDEFMIDYPEGLEDSSHLYLRSALRSTHDIITYPDNFTVDHANVVESTLARVYREFTGKDLLWSEIEKYDRTEALSGEKPF